MGSSSERRNAFPWSSAPKLSQRTPRFLQDVQLFPQGRLGGQFFVSHDKSHPRPFTMQGSHVMGFPWGWLSAMAMFLTGECFWPKVLLTEGALD